ncbi:LysR family transcriptional regulator, partial [Stenotrophomonas maltophilia]|uniref:LysR family transcriptional regulator n=1 Tax=Stenotrophomonas maltophilia TaxID=40324 RepID=UPI0031450FCF
SALSHQMSQLEERLGQPLLIRQPRGITLTLEGQLLLDQVGPHLVAINEAFQPYAARAVHVLTIRAVPTMASAWLVPRLGHVVAE